MQCECRPGEIRWWSSWSNGNRSTELFTTQHTKELLTKWRKSWWSQVFPILCDVTLRTYRDIKKKQTNMWIQIADIGVCLADVAENNCPLGAEYVNYVLNTTNHCNYRFMRYQLLPNTLHQYVRIQCWAQEGFCSLISGNPWLTL